MRLSWSGPAVTAHHSNAVPVPSSPSNSLHNDTIRTVTWLERHQQSTQSPPAVSIQAIAAGRHAPPMVAVMFQTASVGCNTALGKVQVVAQLAGGNCKCHWGLRHRLTGLIVGLRRPALQHAMTGSAQTQRLQLLLYCSTPAASAAPMDARERGNAAHVWLWPSSRPLIPAGIHCQVCCCLGACCDVTLSPKFVRL